MPCTICTISERLTKARCQTCSSHAVVAKICSQPTGRKTSQECQLRLRHHRQRRQRLQFLQRAHHSKPLALIGLGTRRSLEVSLFSSVC